MSRSTPSVALVLATSTGGIGVHVRMLVDGLTRRGWSVLVGGPPATDDTFGFTQGGATFVPARIAGKVADPLAAAALWRATRDVDVVHAHGLRAGLVSAMAGRRPLVVTWHNMVLTPTGLRRRTLGTRWVRREAIGAVCHAIPIGVAAERICAVRDFLRIRHAVVVDIGIGCAQSGVQRDSVGNAVSVCIRI